MLLSIATLQLYAQHDVPPSSEFVVSGAVKKVLKLSIKDLGDMKQDNLGDIVIRNHKGEPKSTAKQLKGVLLKTILERAEITAEKPKEYSEYVILLTATDDYRNVYSWNELFNTDIGNHVYIVTEMDGQSIGQMTDRILVLSLADMNSGSRHLRGLAKIEVKKMP